MALSRALLLRHDEYLVALELVISRKMGENNRLLDVNGQLTRGPQTARQPPPPLPRPKLRVKRRSLPLRAGLSSRVATLQSQVNDLEEYKCDYEDCSIILDNEMR